MHLKLFKAEQIMIVYCNLAKDIDSTIQIHQWTINMYELRRSLLRVVEECSSRNVCKSKCQNGECIRLSEEKRDMHTLPVGNPIYHHSHRCSFDASSRLVSEIYHLS